VLLTSGGGESIEAAVKLARLFHAVNGEPGRHHVISRSHGYHGTHGIGTSILGMPYREGFGPLLQDTSQVEWDSAVALEEEIRRIGAERVAAFVFEPVIGAGGVHVPPPGYLDESVAVCRRHGVLVVADCVIAGFGRLGGWLGVERFHLRPDLITFAKGVTSGYLPLGGVIVAPEVAAPFWDEPGRMFAHGATYGGHATCCAAALANLDVLAPRRPRPSRAGARGRLPRDARRARCPPADGRGAGWGGADGRGRARPGRDCRRPVAAGAVRDSGAGGGSGHARAPGRGRDRAAADHRARAGGGDTGSAREALAAL
jgi:adenosylmethionine-8-amino-7-oxononanoate aminotransferase